MKPAGWIIGLTMPIVVAIAGVLWLRSSPVPPNVLLVTVDTMRADHLGLYGYERPTSPTLDALTRSAVVFDQAYTQATLSAPSHATMFTSLYPPAHGVINNGVTLVDGQLTVAEILKAAGYETGMFVSHRLVGQEFGLGQGFDVIEEYMLHSHGPNHRHEEDIEEEREAPSAVFDAVVRWLGRPRESPFFAWLHVQHPHKSYEPPPPYDTAFSQPPPSEHDLRCQNTLYAHQDDEIDLSPAELSHFVDLYDGELMYVDAQLGRVFDTLRQRGLEDSTVVVVAADHGELLFDDERRRRAGHSTYRTDPVLRVPLIVHDPRREEQARHVPDMVGLIDLAPTLLELAGLEAPRAFRGKSLVPLLDGGTGSTREVNYSCTFHGSGKVRLSARTDRTKLICDKKRGKWGCELFDLQRDAQEWQDLSDDPAYTDELQRVRTGLQDWFHAEMANGVLSGELPKNKKARDLLRRAGYLRLEEQD